MLTNKVSIAAAAAATFILSPFLPNAFAASIDDAPVFGDSDVIVLNANHPAFGAGRPSGPKKSSSKEFSLAESIWSSHTGGHANVERFENFIGQTFVKQVGHPDIPTLAKHQPTPWPGSYWPFYRDATNFAWQGPGTLSPTEKYAEAFGLDPHGLMETVSRYTGIEKYLSDPEVNTEFFPRCTEHWECTNKDAYSACAKRPGASTGVCIPLWYGLCHAWASAAIMEPEPKCPIWVNGVEFRPKDLKGLMTLVYHAVDVPTVFAGARCDDERPEVDEFSRFTNPECRDLTPDVFHILTTNLIGKYQSTFIVDHDATAPVWNQPVRAYQIREQVKMSLEDGARRFFNTDYYPFNEHARSLVATRMRLWWMLESEEDGSVLNKPGGVSTYTRAMDYEYVLEVDENDEIVGGEWIRNSRHNHPDFLWMPMHRPHPGTRVLEAFDYDYVRSMVEASANGNC
ncbi:hypothetical protein HK102_005243 [Quaeritorhiza haematococci]|nr:hypothetical protein HK102_005243 [Quaeritorhiza haematococci]